MIDAALDVLHDGSGWLLITASVAVVVAIRHLRHLHRLRAAAALHDPHGAPLEPFAAIEAAETRWWRAYGDDLLRRAEWSVADETWSNVAAPPGGQRYISTPEQEAAWHAEAFQRFFPGPKPTLYDWSDDDDLA